MPVFVGQVNELELNWPRMSENASDPRSWVPTDEAIKLSGCTSKQGFIKEIRRRNIAAKAGPRNRKLYPRPKLLEIASDREIARAKRVPDRRRDPLNDPVLSGELHAKVFRLFRENTPLCDIVERLSVRADVVEELFVRWWRLGQRTQGWLNSTAQSAPPDAPPNFFAPSPSSGAPVPGEHLAPSELLTVDHSPAPDGSCCPKHGLEIIQRTMARVESARAVTAELRKDQK